MHLDFVIPMILDSGIQQLHRAAHGFLPNTHLEVLSLLPNLPELPTVHFIITATGAGRDGRMVVGIENRDICHVPETLITSPL